MPAMKLTPSAAMRARDVSRPRAEHLAEAEAAEAGNAAGARARTGVAENRTRGEDTTKTPRAPAAAGDEQGGRPGSRGDGGGVLLAEERARPGSGARRDDRGVWYASAP